MDDHLFMKKLLTEAAFDFFQVAYQGQYLSALVFFDDKISHSINHEFYIHYLDEWFCTLINEFAALKNNIKNIIIFEIDGNDIFCGLRR